MKIIYPDSEATEDLMEDVYLIPTGYLHCVLRSGALLIFDVVEASKIAEELNKTKQPSKGAQN